MIQRLSTIIISMLLLFQTAMLHAADKYWVNGGGNWSDAAHWSLTSGGAGGAGVPEPSDNVIIDDFSFTASGQAIFIDKASVVNSMIWHPTGKNPILAGKSSLVIIQSLRIFDVPENNFANIIYLANANDIAVYPEEPNFKIKQYFEADQAFLPISGAFPKALGDGGAITATVSFTNITCFGANDGKVKVEITDGGSAPYTYTWTRITAPATTVRVEGSTASTSDSILNVEAGQYIVTIDDQNDSYIFPASAVNLSKTALNLSISKTDITCNNSNDGTITATGTGGTRPYSFTLRKGGIDQETLPSPATSPYWVTFTGLAQGADYDVVLDDANSCGPVTSAAITINNPSALSISSVVGADATCNGSSDGSITVTASGGTGALEYSSNNGSNWQLANVLTVGAGSHTVKIKDANNCELAYTSNPVLINQPPIIDISNVAKTNITCNGIANGSITITASGGTGALEYSVNNGGSWQAGNSFAGLAVGSYDVKVKDANNCEQAYSLNPVVITEPSAINISNVSKTDITCNGTPNGSITITANGGTPSLQYSINNGGTWQASNLFTNLGSGSYDVKVKDNNNCELAYLSNPVSISEPSALNISDVASVNISCNGAGNGSIAITAAGGTPALSYSINNGGSYQAGNTFNLLSAGSYTVKIKDGNNCELAYISNPVSISEPAAINISNVVKTDILCNAANNGSIVITAAGGTGGLSYSINNGGSWQAGNSFAGLAAGSNTIKVKDINNCEVSYASNPVNITEPGAISISNVSKTDITCNGGANGTITVTASGGTGTLEYSKDNGINYQASNLFTGLTAATYQVKVRDANLCERAHVSTTVIGQPGAFTISVVKTDVSICYGNTNGAINITASGGTSPLNYSTGGAYGANNNFINLAANSYNVSVRDALGCIGTYVSNPVVIGQPAQLLINSVTPTNIANCNGDLTGAISINASGGTGVLNYSINNGFTYQPGSNFSGLAAASYNIKVRDANLCVVTYATNPVVLTQPAAITINNIAKINVSGCFGNTNGSINIDATGGSGSLNYSINNGGVYQASNSFPNLAASSYNVLVRDANNCTRTYTSNPVVVTQPSQINISAVNKTDVTLCFGNNNGSISITAINGTGILQYSIDNGLNYQSSNTFSSIIAGSYNIMVKDANNCTRTYGSNPVVINQPPQLSAAVAVTNVTGCFGYANGSIVITASSGTPPYEYSINNGGSYQPSNTFNGLIAGVYTVLVRDQNGCLFAGATNPITITEPSQINISTVVPTNVTTCFGDNTGAIAVTASGGTGLLQYSIDNGSNYQLANTFSSLVAASYTVKVKDANACEISYASNPVVVSQPALLSISLVTAADATCNGQANGSINVTAVGGTGSILYSVDNGLNYQASNAFNVTAGSYEVKVQDVNLCETLYGFNPVLISEPSAISIDNISKSDVFPCYGDDNGSISITASGGTGTLTYSIDNGVSYQASTDFNALAANNYAIVVKDDNACEQIYSGNPYVITQPLQVSVSSVIASNVTGCSGNNDGSIDITAVGGDGNYEYSIDGGSNYDPSSSFSSLTAGSYIVSVRDGFNCSGSYVSNPVIITEPNPVQVDAVNLTHITSCFGNAEGEIEIIASGGTGALEYSIDGGSNWFASNIFPGLNAGDFDISVRDAVPCLVNHGTVTLTEPAILTIDNVAVTDVTGCAGNPNGEINITVSGGTGTIFYSVDNGLSFSPLNPITGLIEGNYDIVVQDDEACSVTYASNPVTISGPVPITATVNANMPLCNGGSTGSIVIVAAAGGSGAYDYTVDGGLNWVASNNFTNRAAGTYDVRIRDRNNPTCSVILDAALVIGQPGTLTFTYTKQDIICAGSNTGSITITPSGGTAPYSYSRNGGASYPSVDPNSTFSNLSAQNYSVRVKDANACESAIQIVTITQPAELKILSEINNSEGNLCFGDANGVITINASGGVAPIQYSIDNGATFVAGNIFNGLVAGDYRVAVRDNIGCIKSGSLLKILQPGSLNIDFFTKTDVTTCYNDATGAIVFDASGGAGNLHYSIDGINYQDIGVFNNILGGNYTIEVSDDKGCVKDSNVVVNRPPVMYFSSFSKTDETCSGANDASISAVVAGGNGGFSYVLDGGVPQATGDYSALAGGLHTLVVSDADNCTKDTTINLVSPGGLLIDSTRIVAISCNGLSDGSIRVYVSGGTAPFSYTLSAGAINNATGIYSGLAAGTYTVSVTDAQSCAPVVTPDLIITEPSALIIDSVGTTNNACGGDTDGEIRIYASGGTAPYQYSNDNGTTWVPSSVFASLNGGNYVVRLKDAANCEINYGSVNIISPAAIVYDSVRIISVMGCAGDNTGSISIYAKGGTGALSYSINGTDWLPSNIFNSLSAANYTVSVRDANLCQKDTAVVVSQPSALTMLLSATNEDDLNKGSITITASGGTAPLNYSIDNGGSYSLTSVFNGLDAREYYVKVKDAGNCEIIDSITILDNRNLNISIASTPISCFGLSNGGITLTNINGQAPVVYTINNGTGPISQTDNGIFTNLAAGKYIISVGDGLSRSFIDSVVIIMPSQITFTAETTPAGDVIKGTMLLHASNGVSPYEYSINNGVNFQSDSNFTNLDMATYDIVIRDANLCEVSGQVSIPDASDMIISVDSTMVTCFGYADGSITINASNATLPITYTVNNGTGDISNQTGLFTMLAPGLYSINVLDNAGKTATSSVLINQPLQIILTLTSTFTTDTTLGSITANVANNRGPAEFSIDNGINYQLSNVFDSLAVGSYTVIVRDSAGCNANASIDVIDGTNLIVTVDSINPSCAGSANGSITINAVTGVAPVVYTLSDSSGVLETQTDNGLFADLAAGTYFIDVADALLRNFKDTVVLVQPDSLIILSFVTNANDTAKGIIEFEISRTPIPNDTIWISFDNGLTFDTSLYYTNLDTGFHYVLIRSTNACEIRDTLYVGYEKLMNALVATVENVCPGGKNGEILIINLDGVEPVEYSIDNGLNWYTSGIFNPLTSGAYRVVVRDAENKYYRQRVSLTEPMPLTAHATVTNALCAGVENGSVIIDSISGGTPSYTFTWLADATSELSKDSLAPGYYLYRITDSLNCVAVDSLSIINLGGISSIAFVYDSAECNGSTFDAKIRINNVIGGTAPFSFIWNNDSALIADSLVNVNAGIYTLSITDSIGCKSTFNADVPFRYAVNVFAGIDDTICYGTSAQLIAIASDSTALYTWGPLDSIAGQNNNDTINSKLLFYPRNEFIVSAAKGNCVSTDTVVIYQYSRQVPSFANTISGDTIVAQGSSLQLLVDPSINFKEYIWTPNLYIDNYVPVTLEPFVNVSPQDINGTGFLVYSVQSMSLPEYGSCKESASITIHITGTPEPYTGFTPNGDGMNDYWLVKNAAFNQTMTVDVFNRWGEIVYSQKGCSSADGADCEVWDGKRNGKDVPIGTYYYVVNLNDGSNALTGTITIVR